ncbi:uncharacterized protein EDB91DRAFT_1246024 [Suillus paluster]|uniref:uncharacterized protein n=1 Tax=Suillus paluster TaxID=48578 RepID=UPI001B8678A8|nr:uncharacterized protein EDB91DRAFT_1246024 [Suillus paluster]KAG1745884.1 hypothetical protein EDB91DRAFT_1246024 [Suillus paluster]
MEDGWADLIIIAECLDYGKALVEFARILNKDGTVVMIWNLEDREAAPWVARLYDRRNVHEKDTTPLEIDLLRQPIIRTSNLLPALTPGSRRTMVQGMTSSELAKLIKSDKVPDKDYLIVDVRDEDWKGGNIKGSRNYPSQNFLLGS